MQLFTGVAIVSGVLMAGSNWVYFGFSGLQRNRFVKLLVSLIVGLSAFTLSWLFWMSLLLGLGYVD